jgi:hypothetical protein
MKYKTLGLSPAAKLGSIRIEGMQKLPFSHFRLIETWILQCVPLASILHLAIVSTKHPSLHY